MLNKRKKNTDITLKVLDTFIYKTFLNKEFTIKGWTTAYNPIEGEIYWVKGHLKVQATPFFSEDTEMCILIMDSITHKADYIKSINMQDWFMFLKYGKKPYTQFLTYYFNIMSGILKDDLEVNQYEEY